MVVNPLLHSAVAAFITGGSETVSNHDAEDGAIAEGKDRDCISHPGKGGFGAEATAKSTHLSSTMVVATAKILAVAVDQGEAHRARGTVTPSTSDSDNGVNLGDIEEENEKVWQVSDLKV
ncbi:hypothetical protein PIB30_095852 [Stylosanthes scabra]|uniref:Uncharacterized protein n=1 Tax=Stylosanthes scabra TaxID=79078 RepID=A0ABU6XUX3_9FABA|nr:hypothetical protein [Stylosanthes scabra]